MTNRIKVGTAGFSYKEWENIVYPASFKSTERLAYVSQFLDLVEINSSFYGPIRPNAGRTWCKAVAGNRDFVFTAKLYRAFTHSPVAVVESTSAKTIRFEAKDIDDTKAGFDALAEQNRLGAVLVQFPMSFKQTNENRAHIEGLIHRFREYPLVLEVRHASLTAAEVLRWLTELNVGLCNIDQPLLGRAIRPGSHATGHVGYIRLHGRNYKEWFSETTNARDRYDYLYSKKELMPWKERAEEVAAKTDETFVVTNNHNLGKAAVNALELLNLLNGLKVKAPAPLIEAYPQLASIAVPLPEK